jgi:ankyrin repeat protein
LYNHTATAELLIAQGVDVNAKANNGRTSLHFASEKSHKEIAKLLIKKGVDVNAKRNDSATPLDEADDEETIALLRKHGGKTGEELKAEGK